MGTKPRVVSRQDRTEQKQAKRWADRQARRAGRAYKGRQTPEERRGPRR